MIFKQERSGASRKIEFDFERKRSQGSQKKNMLGKIDDKKRNAVVFVLIAFFVLLAVGVGVYVDEKTTPSGYAVYEVNAGKVQQKAPPGFSAQNKGAAANAATNKGASTEKASAGTGAVIGEGSSGSSGKEGQEETRGQEEQTEQPTKALAEEVALLASVEMRDFELPLRDVDITINARDISMTSEELDIKVKPSEEINLRGFSGTLAWSDLGLVLEGTFYSYVSDSVNMNLKGKKHIQMKLKQGTLSIGKLSFDSLDVVVAGNVSFDDSMKLNLDNEPVIITSYTGSFKTRVDGMRNTVFLDGTVKGFTSSTEDFFLHVS